MPISFSVDWLCMEVWSTQFCKSLQFVALAGLLTRLHRGFKLAGLDKFGIATGVLGVLVIIIVEAMSAWYNYRRAKNLIPEVEPLTLKGYKRTKSKDVVVEERMLSDMDANTEYMHR